MKISTSAAAPATANVDMLAVSVAKPVALEGAVAELDRALGGTIGRLAKRLGAPAVRAAAVVPRGEDGFPAWPWAGVSKSWHSITRSKRRPRSWD